MQSGGAVFKAILTSNDNYTFPAKMSGADPKFEVTQIMASRVDDAGKWWYLVQWGCTWVPRNAMVDGPIRTAWTDTAKMRARVTIPQELSDASDDAPVAKRAR